MSSAYGYAEGEPLPDELALAWMVDKYGAQAVYGRHLSFQEIRSMSLAQNVYNAYKERERSDSWAKWASANPEKARLLADAGKLFDEEE